PTQDPSTSDTPPLPAGGIGPPTSLTDPGLSKRPRDARTLHVLMSSLGVHAYQERVPLQLMDFAYRYTAGVLGDAVQLSANGYGAPAGRGAGAGATAGEPTVTMAALRLAIASRQNYQFQHALPKEWLLDLAAERNRVQLPGVGRGFGLRLPPEKYCLTGVGWNLKDEWESEEEVDLEMGAEGAEEVVNGVGDDEKMEDAEGLKEEEQDEFEEVMGGGETQDTAM
ncbi:TFIID-31kDa-domain-containing protein, partial [Eremomyces bilateralis CBS 781.70]